MDGTARAGSSEGCYRTFGKRKRNEEDALPKTQITSPKLPAPMRGGAFSSGVEAPAGRTVYVSGQVSM